MSLSDQIANTLGDALRPWDISGFSLFGLGRRASLGLALVAGCAAMGVSHLPEAAARRAFDPCYEAWLAVQRDPVANAPALRACRTPKAAQTQIS